jgi:zinc protease
MNPDRMMARTFAAVAAVLMVGTPLAGQQKEKPPAPGAPKDFALPTKREFTLDNGMKVTLVPFGKVPKASISLAVATGNIDEGPNETWLADVTGDLMNEGTTSKAAQQIAEETAGMGGSVSVGVGADQTTIGGAVLAERAADFVRLIADVAQRPALPPSELPRILANRERDLAVARSQAQPLAQERFYQVLYGDHPYSHLYPTPEMLKGYTIERVRSFYAGNFGAARAHLYVAGVYDATEVERAVREAFSGWAAGKARTVNIPKPKSGRRMEVIDRPDAVQSTLVIGLPAIDPSNPDYKALEVTDGLLGGVFASRITANIREDKGYTYSPFSSIVTHYRTGHWEEDADVTTNVTGASLKEIFNEIDRLRKEAPPPAELRGVQNTLSGIFVLRNSSRGGVIGMLQEQNLHGLPDTYLSEYVKRLYAVTSADVQRMMQTYLRPENMAIVVVGDKKTIQSQLAPFASYVP